MNRPQIDAAILELENRLAHLKRTPVGDGGRIMARGVVNQAARVAALLNAFDLPPVDEDCTPCPDCHRRHSPLVLCAGRDYPLLQELRELSLEMEAPAVMTGNRGFRRFWPRLRSLPSFLTDSPEERRERELDEQFLQTGFLPRRGSHD